MSGDHTDSADHISETLSVDAASLSNTYKVLGKFDAPSGSGVRGHNTATTGTAVGVLGRTDSSRFDAAGVRAEAPNGGRGLYARAGGNEAIRADAPFAPAVVGLSDESGVASIVGINTASGGVSSGLLGRTDSPDSGSRGVFGRANASTGRTYGVHGTTDSQRFDAAGVRAEATNGARGLHATADGNEAIRADASNDPAVVGVTSEAGVESVHGINSAASGVSYGVRGRTDSAAAGASGVYGRAAATTGDVHGVKGVTESGNYYASGVYAEADGNAPALIAKALDDGEGIRASSPNDYGAEIETSEPGYAGVLGTNLATSGHSYGLEGVISPANDGSVSPAGVHGSASPSSGSAYGVLGQTSGDEYWNGGVRGVATNNSGHARGVVGETKSGDYGAAGVQGIAGGNAVGVEAHGGGRGVEAYAGQAGVAAVEGINYYGDDTKNTRGVAGNVYEEGAIGVYGENRGQSNWGYGIYGKTRQYSGMGTVGILTNGSGNGYGVYGGTHSSDGYGVYSDGDLYVNGDVKASGSKPFVETVSTSSGPKEIVYTAVEAAGVHTEVSGVETLSGGRAEIDLPDHFDKVTDSAEPIVVQTTPYGGSNGLKVVERSTNRVVVEDLNGTGDYEFAYIVRGTRDGYANHEVVREAESHPTPQVPESSSGTSEPPQSPPQRPSHPDPPEPSSPSSSDESDDGSQ